MKGRLWLCLAVSLLCHALFFPDLLQAMMASGAANKPAKVPERVNIKLVPKRPKAEKVAVVKPPPPAKPKPKPKPKELPKRQPVKPPVAKTPPPRPRPPQERPIAAQPQPRPRPAANPRPASRPPRSTRRLTGTAPGRRPVAAVPVPRPSREANGQAGVVPARPGATDLPVGDGDGEGPAGPPTREPVSAAPPPPAAEPATPEPEPTPAPKREPPPKPPKPAPAEEPSRTASSTPKMREASIEVPTIKLPANLRRDSLKVSLQVRVVVEANGQVDFKLGDTSGNADVDDYVLEQLRKVAIVTTALDDQGQPKRTMKRVRVDIEVD